MEIENHEGWKCRELQHSLKIRELYREYYLLSKRKKSSNSILKRSFTQKPVSIKLDEFDNNSDNTPISIRRDNRSITSKQTISFKPATSKSDKTNIVFQEYITPKEEKHIPDVIMTFSLSKIEKGREKYENSLKSMNFAINILKKQNFNLYLAPACEALLDVNISAIK